MYVLVKEANGTYYYSTAFGFYCQVTAKDDYQRYLERVHNRFFYVLNREKTALIRKRVFEWDNKYLDPMVLIVDTDDSDWNKSSDSSGCTRFLEKYRIEALAEQISGDDLSRCITIDCSYHYDNYHMIQGEKDIENFMTATGGLHDARIAYWQAQRDSLYLRFDGAWGCEVELWFDGNAEYCMASRNRDDNDPYWLDSSLFIQDNFVFLVDDCEMTADKITDDYCWFKAKSAAYRIIPTWAKQNA